MLFLKEPISTYLCKSTIKIKGVRYGILKESLLKGIVYSLDTLKIRCIIERVQETVKINKNNDDILDFCKIYNIKLKDKTFETNMKDTYTEDILKEQYNTHKHYYLVRKESSDRLKIKFRLPCIPEDISENIIKFILHYKRDDTTSSWSCNKGDLESKVEGIQECKCFTSDGPLSFTPSGDWDVIYFLDARKWLEDNFILYRVPLKRTSTEWLNIKVSKTQTFGDQCDQGRRPHISWDALSPQIHYEKIYEGTFKDIFN